MVTLKTHKKFRRDKLAKLFAKKGLNVGVEVGVRYGQYAQIMCEANPDLKLYAVDPWDIVYRDYRSNRMGKKKQELIYEHAIERLKPFNCELIKKESLDAVKDFEKESIDFVYIDGSHEFDYVMTDIIEWAKIVRKGGIIAGHDYYSFKYGDVIASVNAFCNSKMHRVRRINLTDERTPSWWFERKW